MPDQVRHDDKGPRHDAFLQLYDFIKINIIFDEIVDDMEAGGYIYIMTNKSNSVLYIGVTNDIARRKAEHSSGQGSEFTRKYNCTKLVYFEFYPDINQAISREKQLKNWRREWKEALIEKINPNWQDLEAIGRPTL